LAGNEPVDDQSTSGHAQVHFKLFFFHHGFLKQKRVLKLNLQKNLLLDPKILQAMTSKAISTFVKLCLNVQKGSDM